MEYIAFLHTHFLFENIFTDIFIALLFKYNFFFQYAIGQKIFLRFHLKKENKKFQNIENFPTITDSRVQ